MVNDAAMSSLSPSGMGIKPAALAMTCSANPPRPMKAMTRSPSLTLLTPSPSAATRPATSVPGMKGSSGWIWYFFWMISTSGKLTEALAMSISTSPAAGAGSVMSSTTRLSAGPQALQTTAFMRALLLGSGSSVWSCRTLAVVQTIFATNSAACDGHLHRRHRHAAAHRCLAPELELGDGRAVHFVGAVGQAQRARVGVEAGEHEVV